MKAAAPSASIGGYRLGIASRAVAAVAGSYGLAVLASMAVAATFAGSLGARDAVGLGQMIGFLLYTGAVIWAFSCSSALRAWAGIALATLVAGAWLLVVRGLA